MLAIWLLFCYNDTNNNRLNMLNQEIKKELIC